MTGVTAPAAEVIKAENLWRVYKAGAIEVRALRGINLQIGQGTFVALKGRSGSGKTTLLNCLGGLDQPTSGAVYILGQNLAHLKDSTLTRWRRERVGFVFQSFGLIPTLSAYENVELMLRLKGTPAKESHQRTLACLDLVGVNKWSHHRPYEMSGGQQQRVAIARSLVHDPKLVVCDEPTSSLDHETGHQVMEIMREVAAAPGRALVVVTHDSRIFGFADRIAKMDDGHIEKVVTSAEQL